MVKRQNRTRNETSIVWSYVTVEESGTSLSENKCKYHTKEQDWLEYIHLNSRSIIKPHARQLLS